jgi:C4-dicarboxylate transporter DctM subunit
MERKVDQKPISTQDTGISSRTPGLVLRISRTLAKIVDWTSNIGGILSSLLILVIALIVFYEIILRAVFNHPTTWVLEYSIYMLIATSFLGASYTAKCGRHVCVDVITSRLSERTKISLEFVTLLWSIGFTFILVYTSILMVRQSWVQNRLSTSILETPMFITEIPVAVGAVLLLLQLISMAVDRGSLMITMKKTEEERSTAIGLLDRPLVLIPLFVALLVVGVILFTLGGGFRTAGLILLMLTLLATGTPVFLSLAILGSLGLFFLLGGSLASQFQVALQAYKAVDSFTLEAIPLFIMSASLFATTGLTDKLFDITKSWLSFLPGNMAMASIVSCAIFAAISGSSVATAATIGLIAVPAMLAANYEKGLALGSVSAGGTLGILIPPSLSFILIGEITETSVGQLFIAGVIPGIFLTIIFLGYLFLVVRKDPRYKPSTSYTWKERLRLLRKGTPVLMAPVIILGGIYTGIFTPTEAASVSVIYAIVLLIVTGKLRGQNVLVIIRESTLSAVMVLMIIVGATILGSVITLIRIPQNFADLVVASQIPPWGVVVLMCLLLLVLGMFLECASITMITVPIFYPAIVETLGYHPFWFAVIFTINMELALITPPVGLNLYVIKGISEEKMETVIRGALPFVILLALGLLIIALIEPMSTWLPSTMMSK